jgi:hypothetical protein
MRKMDRGIYEAEYMLNQAIKQNSRSIFLVLFNVLTSTQSAVEGYWKPEMLHFTASILENYSFIVENFHGEVFEDAYN